MLESSPTTIASLSPRSTAVGHTLTRAPSVTLPMTCAAGWTKAVGWIAGTLLPAELRHPIRHHGEHRRLLAAVRDELRAVGNHFHLAPRAIERRTGDDDEWLGKDRGL